MNIIYKNNKPIIAISTVLGFGGINIIRISGYNIDYLIYKLCNKKKKYLFPRYAIYTSFKKKNGNLIDKGIIIYYKSPFSYTGEDIFELQFHGGEIIAKILLLNCLILGNKIKLRLAKKGEFTKRSFLNNKISLNQVEGILNIIKSSNKYDLKFTTSLYFGKFYKLINLTEKNIKNIFFFLEGYINFFDNNINIKKKKIIKNILLIKNNIKKLILFFSKNINYKKKINISIIGQPNVGKSSLFNLLTNSNSSIITSIPGTTRDKIKKKIKINNIYYYIVDTAGIKLLNKNILNINEIEFIGIKKTWEEIKKSDIILYIIDINKGFSLKDKEIIKLIPKNILIIYLWNKIDILNKKIKKLKNNKNNIFISILKKKNINFIKNNLYKLNKIYNKKNKYKFLFFFKKINLLKKIKKKINFIIKNIFFLKFNLDLLTEEIKIIYNLFLEFNLKKIKINLLNKIFSKFCIGK